MKKEGRTGGIEWQRTEERKGERDGVSIEAREEKEKKNDIMRRVHNTQTGIYTRSQPAVHSFCCARTIAPGISGLNRSHRRRGLLTRPCRGFHSRTSKARRRSSAVVILREWLDIFYRGVKIANTDFLRRSSWKK